MTQNISSNKGNKNKAFCSNRAWGSACAAEREALASSGALMMRMRLAGGAPSSPGRRKLWPPWPEPFCACASGRLRLNPRPAYCPVAWESTLGKVTLGVVDRPTYESESMLIDFT